MARNLRTLTVFQDADRLVIDVYKATRSFPPEERYALQIQLRAPVYLFPVTLSKVRLAFQSASMRTFCALLAVLQAKRVASLQWRGVSATWQMQLQWNSNGGLMASFEVSKFLRRG